ncbi:MAG TPA: hypothetical protein PKU91_02495, partial [Phycisphaerales bacterium]|nr:hypothetical protein [Phycisphaerales bacterium]
MDHGVAPEKYGSGPDKAVAARGAITPSDDAPLVLSIGGESSQWPVATDVNRIAASTRWANLEDVRRAKSAIGSLLVTGGIITAATADDNDTQVMVGLIVAGVGALLKASSAADIQHNELFPQRTYLALADLNAPVNRVELAIGGRSPSRLVLPDVPAGPRGGLALASVAHAMAEGILLGLYSYHGQKTSEKPTDLPDQALIYGYSDEDLPALRSGVATGMAYARGTILARDLVNLPPNICTPAFLAQRAQEVAEQHKVKIQILERQQMKALKMGALLAVAQGSETPPRFIVLEYQPDDLPQPETLVLVGKGVTFDTGGYSMKSVDGMVGMKG